MTQPVIIPESEKQMWDQETATKHAVPLDRMSSSGRVAGRREDYRDTRRRADISCIGTSAARGEAHA